MLNNNIIAVLGLAEIVRNTFLGVVGRAKHIVHEIKFAGEILIDRFRMVRMMPAMKFGVAQDVANPMGVFDIAVTISAPEVSKWDIYKDQRRVWLEIGNQHQIGSSEEGFIDNMESARWKRVQG